MSPDKTKSAGVFDVTKPGRFNPEPSSRPVLQQQTMPSDPSIKEVGFDKTEVDGTAVPITINRVEPTLPEPPAPARAPAIAEDNEADGTVSGGEHPPMSESQLFQSDSGSAVPPHAPQPGMGIAGGNKPPKRTSKMLLWTAVLLVVLAVAGYLAIDSRLIKTSIGLPFHFFSQTDDKSSSSNNQASASTAPNGFSHYQLADAAIQFDAPSAWGTPSFSTDPGFSQRSSTAKSDGTHAYVVDFANNKKVELAMTNGTILPASSTESRYFDGLQWCSGTIDKQYYIERLLYTTSAKKVDTPATVVCDQGPFTTAAKIDDSAVMLSKVTSTKGTVLGDIYVKNMSGNSSGVVVFRALDTTSENGSDIRTLLSTVKNL